MFKKMLYREALGGVSVVPGSLDNQLGAAVMGKFESNFKSGRETENNLPVAASDIGCFVSELVEALYKSNPEALKKILDDENRAGEGLLPTIEDAKYALSQVLLQDRGRHTDNTAFEIEWLQMATVDITRTIHAAKRLIEVHGI